METMDAGMLGLLLACESFDIDWSNTAGDDGEEVRKGKVRELDYMDEFGIYKTVSGRQTQGKRQHKGDASERDFGSTASLRWWSWRIRC